MRLKRTVAICAAALALIAVQKDSAESKIRKAATQTVYVPVYSSIYHGDRKREFNLAVTVSIRNTDMNSSIILEHVDYYDTTGKMLKRYQAEKRTLRPLESVQYMVRESDTRGGIGANFIVTWRSAGPVSGPIIESIMIGTGGQQGISFTSRGVVISEE